MTRVGFLTSFIGITAALTAGLALAGRPAGASFPGQNGLIVFRSNRDSNDEIYAMNSDGSEQRRLTLNAAFDPDPTFSPDGSKIAFTNLGGLLGDSEIFDVSASDASGLRPLTNNGTPDCHPAYSPETTDRTPLIQATVRDRHTISLTATDEAGLSKSRQRSFRVARADQRSAGTCREENRKAWGRGASRFTP